MLLFSFNSLNFNTYCRFIGNSCLIRNNLVFIAPSLRQLLFTKQKARRILLKARKY